MKPSPAFRPFLVLMVLGLTFRALAWWFLMDRPERFLEVDSFSYLNPARALAETGRFSVSPDQPEVPERVRTPGYPLWLAFWIKLTGAGVAGLSAGQWLLFAATLALTYALGARLWGPRAGLAAAAFVTVDPVNALYGLKILPEPLATLLTLVFAWTMLRYLETGGARRFGLAAGTALGLATLVRPTTLYFLPLLLGFAAWVHRRDPLRGLLVRLGWLALPFVLLAGGWTLRNYSVAHRFQFNEIHGCYLYQWKGAQMVAYRQNIPFSRAQALLAERIRARHPALDALPEEAQSRLYLQELKRLIREDPVAALVTQGQQMALFFFAPGTTSALFRLWDPGFRAPGFDVNAPGPYFQLLREHYPGYLAAVLTGGGYLLVLYFFACLGIRRACGRESPAWRRGFLVFALLLVFYIAGVSGVGAGNAQSRMVVGPLIALFAGAGVERWAASRRTRAGRPDFANSRAL